jgi:hypothetical protein
MTSCPVVRLPRDVGSYRAGLGRNRRYTLQRKTKCLAEAGRVHFTRATNPADVEAAFESVVALHQQRWSPRPGGGVFADERAKRFHRDIVRVLSERGRVSLDLLLLDGRPIAGIYGFVYQGVIISICRGSLRTCFRKPVRACSCCTTAFSRPSVTASGWWIYCKAHNRTNSNGLTISEGQSRCAITTGPFELWLSSCWRAESRLPRYC